MKETVGFWGGFADARSSRIGCGTAGVLPRPSHDRRYVADKKDARPVLQHRTGMSNSQHELTEDILAHMPRWKRWGFYTLAAGLVTGIIPLAAAELLADALNGVLLSLESIMGQGMMAALGIGLCIAAIVACMVYLFRLVER